MNEINLAAYASRIGYSGNFCSSIDVLVDLHRLHTVAIPFENLNPFLGIPVDLDLEAIQDKLVKSGRGGYCYEHNILFSAVLREVGFDVTWLSARVVWGVPDGTTMPRTHMVLLVRTEQGDHIADVGFGGMSLTSPLKFVTDVVQTTTHEPFRLIARKDLYLLQANYGGQWNSLYQFDLQEQALADYEVANFYVSQNPKSRFVNGIIAGRVEPGRRYALFNNEFAVHTIGGETTRQTITDVPELRIVLEKDFHINLESLPTLDSMLVKLIGSR